jgi:hypothetical protein
MEQNGSHGGSNVGGVEAVTSGIFLEDYVRLKKGGAFLVLFYTGCDADSSVRSLVAP